MVPISVCMIAKNEEANIERCLAPLVPYHFEIIVVDTGSTDHTKELALKYTDKVYDFEWIDDFSAARNFSLKKASHNYVLVLDSDEFLSDIDLEGIDKAIEAKPKGVGLLLRNNYFTSSGIKTNYPDRVERLFHKRYFHYEWRIHEQVADIKTGSTFYDRYEIPLTVEHVGYSGSEEEKLAKVERNNYLLFKEIEKHPNDSYLYFQVGQSYNFIHDYENAYIYYKKAFELPFDAGQLWAKTMAVTYINVMVNTGRAKEAIRFFEPRYADYADYADFFDGMGLAYLNNNELLKALMEFDRAIKCPTVHEEGANTFVPYYNIGLINEMLGNLESAISFYRKCGNYIPALEGLQRLGV